MTPKTASSRRSFLKGGALAAAPLAVAVPAVALAHDEARARLARLEDEAAIRNLHQAWLRAVNAGAADAAAGLFADPRRAKLDKAVRAVAADHLGAPDTVEIAANGLTAKGRFACAVETAAAMPQDCTLAQMAHAQGEGVIRRTDRRVLHAGYVKADGVWAIASLGLEAP